MTVMTQTHTTTTLGNYLLERLQSYGVQYAFSIRCDSVLHLNKFLKQHAIQTIYTIQENNAGYMAGLYGRMRGLGVACISYRNSISSISALAQAYTDNSPVLFISVVPAAEDKSNHPHRDIARANDHTQLAIFRQFTVDQAVIKSPIHAIDAIERILHSCLKYKKPVYLELSSDILEAKIQIDAPLYNHTFYHPQAMQELLYEVSKLMRESRRPCIWMGHEVQRFGVLKPLLVLAEKFHIPIVTSLLGKSVVSEQHPLFVGVYQGNSSLKEVRDFVEGCDLILKCGVTDSESEQNIFTNKQNKKQRININAESVRINHHLYPDVHFTACLEAMSHLDLNIRYRHAYLSNIDRVHSPFIPISQNRVTKERFFACLDQHLRAENIVVTDIRECLSEAMNLTVEQDAFYSCTPDLGLGLLAAITAQLTVPKKRVIAIIEDNAFQMTANELSTAVRYGIDPIIIVLNSSGKIQQKAVDKASSEAVHWDYSVLTTLLGAGNSYKVHNEDELQLALSKSTSQRGAFSLIEINLHKSHTPPTLQYFN